MGITDERTARYLDELGVDVPRTRVSAGQSERREPVPTGREANGVGPRSEDQREDRPDDKTDPDQDPEPDQCHRAHDDALPARRPPKLRADPIAQFPAGAGADEPRGWHTKTSGAGTTLGTFFLDERSRVSGDGGCPPPRCACR